MWLKSGKLQRQLRDKLVDIGRTPEAGCAFSWSACTAQRKVQPAWLVHTAL